MFKTYSSESIARIFFNGYFFGSMLLGFVGLYGFISGAGVSSTLCGLMYIAIVSLLSLNKIFRKNPLALVFCFFTFLYLNIPSAFILLEGSDYIFGNGLAFTPFKQSAYQQSLPLAFLYLSVLWIVIWFGIISAGTKVMKINQNYFSSIKLIYIYLLGSIVLVVTFIDGQAFANVRLQGVEKVNSLLAFVFFDHAYLIMAGLILLFKLSEPRYIKNPIKITTLVFIMFVAFTSLSFIGGSKGAILVTSTLFILLPFFISRVYSHAQITFPSIKFIAFLLFLAMPLFYFALIQRINLATDIEPNLDTLLLGVSEFDMDVASDIVKQILYRLSWGGLDRFILILQSFVIDTYDIDTAREFVNYLTKNTLNLLLPGTPFLESYAPSSQLFLQVIQKNLIGVELSSSELILSFNTQPYTAFGIFVIIFGFAAPIFLYLFTFFYAFIFNKINHVFIKITMLYFWLGFMNSYGIEVVLGNSLQLLVSMLLMYWILKIISKFKHFKYGLNHVKSNRTSHNAKL